MDSPYIGRIVTLLSPVFIGLSGWISTRAADVLPGNPVLDTTELTSLFAAGALAGAGLLFKWLDNRGKHEQALAASASVAAAAAPGPPEKLTYNPKTKSYEIGAA